MNWTTAIVQTNDYQHYYAILSLFQNIKRQEERQCEITIPHFLAWNNSKAVVINTLWEVVTCKRAWTSTSAAGGFKLPFFCALVAAIPLILHSVFPPYCAAHEPSAQTWMHVLRWPFSNSSKAFKTFSWEVKYKGGYPAGYTSNVISVLHTTECRGAAHARQLMAGTPSFRRLVSPESVRLMKPAKQWIQCEMWLAVGHGEFVKGYQGLGQWKAKFLHTASFFLSFFSIRAGPWTSLQCDTNCGIVPVLCARWGHFFLIPLTETFLQLTLAAILSSVCCPLRPAVVRSQGLNNQHNYTQCNTHFVVGWPEKEENRCSALDGGH